LLPELTTNQKGLVAETAIMYEAVKLGCGVARPLDDEKYDLILDLGVTLLRVQCKWAVRHGDVVVIRCRTCRRGREGLIHRGYEPGEIDAIAAYCAELDRCYLLPTAMSVGRTAVQLRLAPTRNNQRTGIHWASDFELGGRLSDLGPIAQLGERLRGTQEAGGSSPPGSTSEQFRLLA
jgi:hypothetical protein